MNIEGLDYNTQREQLILPEYGREVQKMVDYAVTLLRRRGLIESAPRYAPDGGCLANEYRLTREGALESARVMMRAFGKKPVAAATA